MTTEARKPSVTISCHDPKYEMAFRTCCSFVGAEVDPVAYATAVARLAGEAAA